MAGVGEVGYLDVSLVVYVEAMRLLHLPIIHPPSTELSDNLSTHTSSISCAWPRPTDGGLDQRGGSEENGMKSAQIPNLFWRWSWLKD